MNSTEGYGRVFPRGTRLKDVPPDFRGIPLAEWRHTSDARAVR